jgi:hypothetical protein
MPLVGLIEHWVVNIVIAVIGVAVFIGWMRNRRREEYRDIQRAEISDDLAAQDQLLEDALAEHRRSDESSGGG